MSEQKIIAGLLELVRDMGCVIRQIDEAGDFNHFWQDDGGYVPDGRYKAGVEHERNAGVPVIAEAPSGGVTWTLEDEARLDAAIARRAAARACPICGPNIPLPGEQCTREHGCAIGGVSEVDGGTLCRHTPGTEGEAKP